MSKSGILKLKSKYEEKSINLLVFGYQSKLFRNDTLALQIDRESHLIPSQYDPTCMISRYDVRATVSEIAPYEATSNTSINRLDGLSESEKQAELLAEEERYYSLYRNEVEEELYKEEQEKREAAAKASSAYNQVAFSYDQQDQQPQEIGPKIDESAINNTESDEEAKFIPIESLQIPPDMELPPTVKLNQIIEKTAKFISTQGAQMEILLKTKQAANPQFNFLNHDGQYNPYYRHILLMMKNNTYPWHELSTTSETENSDEKSIENASENGNSTATNGVSTTTTTNTSPVFIPKMQYKPSAECTYTQIISKITKAPISELEKKSDEQQSESKKKKVEALGLLQNYNSSDDSNSDDDDNDDNNDEGEKTTFSIPPEIQVTIDKTALYVAKNGIEFERKLIDKQSQMFCFLKEDNEFHAYYKTKVKQNISALNIQIEPPEAPKIATILKEQAEEAAKKMPKAPPPPICFSIKAKQEKSPKLAKSSAMMASSNSDDEQKEEEENKKKNFPDCPSPPKISEVEEELERQVDIVNAEREEKLAKEKLSDKLFVSARERLGMLPKDKMLQIERKKKLMMFLSEKIKGSNGNSSNGETKNDEIINLVQNDEDSNEGSVKSSTSTIKSKHRGKSSRSRSRRRSSSSSSSTSSSSSRSRSSSPSSRSSDSSPRRKRSKSSHKKRKHRKSSESRKKSRHRSRSRSHSRSYKSSRRRKH